MQLVQDPGHGASVVGVTNVGNSVRREGLEPKSLAFRDSVLPLPHIGFLMLRLCPDVMAMPCVCSSLPQKSVQTTTCIYVHKCICT